MNAVQTVKNIINDYIDRCESLVTAAKPLDGLFGFGADPRKDECHERFYADMQTAVDAMVKEPIAADEAYAVADLILTFGSEPDCPDVAHWTLISVQKLLLPLLPLMEEQHKHALYQWYNAHVPRFERLPIQKEVIKALNMK